MNYFSIKSKLVRSFQILDVIPAFGLSTMASFIITLFSKLIRFTECNRQQKLILKRILTYLKGFFFHQTKTCKKISNNRCHSRIRSTMASLSSFFWVFPVGQCISNPGWCHFGANYLTIAVNFPFIWRYCQVGKAAEYINV